MVQFRRLDPLANAGPFQRLVKSPVKSVSMTEAQYNRVLERRPDLVIHSGDAAVVGVPYRDYLEIHYGFQEVADFSDNFGGLFQRIVGASSRDEAPRGVLLSFRDRPNRNLAETGFWTLALEETGQWVELSLLAVPEQDEPGEGLADGFTIREATDADRDVVADLEAEVSGKQRLSAGGLDSLFEHARTIQLVRDGSGTPVGFVALRTEPGGWGVIELIAIREGLRDQLRAAVVSWSVAWLRNHQGRRIRQRVYLDDTAQVAYLREAGFTPGESGIDYGRPVEQADIDALLAARQDHGTLIKFGDWR